jgi:hypothetical protein
LNFNRLDKKYNVECYLHEVRAFTYVEAKLKNQISMFTKILGLHSFKMILSVLIIGLMAVSCKNQKKAANKSNKEEVKKEITAEIEKIANADIEIKPDVSVPTAKPDLKSDQVMKYFSAIADAGSIPEANNNIREALTMFSSSEAVVLIEVFNSENDVDYDEPTTISKYLNYVKDQKRNPNKIQDIVYDSNGKIKELVLRKSL